MFTELTHQSLQGREAELRRFAEEQRRVRAALEGAPERTASCGPRPPGGEPDCTAPARPWWVRRSRRASAAGCC
ncbi:hypothetical protein GXW83_28020 [Streptacidiphilus sp. PB12-B1b]|uniref:hypothetical protein n=1 Tax=Streptacidiphilus sp. PB12-B1b TaxID=2705012 RepID=UPI0015FD7C1A|nr:hypothetical protein [Streptacidiphilus sp. PB12-B1b]QMU78980.1 hypothetical protein GXW83_28020 [Streptacidiphilus sp. PB12-B1b]